MSMTLALMQRLKCAPGLARIGLRVHRVPGFGLVVMISWLPVDAFNPTWLTGGPVPGQRRFSNRGEFLWDWLEEQTILAFGETPHEPGEMVGLMLHRAAITDAHTRLLQGKAA